MGTLTDRAKSVGTRVLLRRAEVLVPWGSQAPTNLLLTVDGFWRMLEVAMFYAALTRFSVNGDSDT